MGYKQKIAKFFLLFASLYLLVFLTLNFIDFWHWIKREISFSKKVEELQNTVQENEEIPYTEKGDSIEVPKIEVKAPLVLVESSENEDFLKALDRGVVLHPQSVLPGEKGKILILGHSAPSGYPQINYDWVFSRLNELEPGDQIYINFQKRRYSYNVSQKIFLEKGEEIPKNLTNSLSMLYLITCWPPGRDIERIAIKAEPTNY